MGVKYLGGMHMLNNQPLENDKVQYVSKLRFVNFKNNLDWDLKKFSSYIKLYRGSSPRPISEYLTHDKDGVNWIKIGDTKNSINSKIYTAEEKITTDGAKKSRLVQKGELILANSMSYGKTYELAIDGCIYDGWFVLREYEEHFYKPFLLHILNSDYMQLQYKKLAAGGVVQNISSEIVYQTLIPHTSFEEQEKIANCLSSITQLILEEENKLSNYTKHKEGLLKHLFPKEIETIPKLRLSKFSDKWKAVELSQIAKAVKKKNSTEDEIKVLSLSNEHGLVSQADYFLKKVAGDNTDRYIILQKNDFVYNDRITKNSTYGTIKRLSLYESGIVSPIYKCFRFEKTQDPVFWEYFFESKTHESEIKQIVNEGARAGRYNISIDKFLSINVMQPSFPEQEKIASCLTSLDHLISHQKNYIDQLKRHKKGLMQQLFPVVEEI